MVKPKKVPSLPTAPPTAPKPPVPPPASNPTLPAIPAIPAAPPVPKAPPLPEWLAKLYPFTPRSFMTPRGARMSYLDEGPRDDAAVLMLHGNPTWSFYYRNLVRELVPKLRCVVPDHVGMGLSEKAGGLRVLACVADRRRGGAGRVAAAAHVYLVVHDWGGAIGFGFAARHPEMIVRVVVLNTAAFASPRLPWQIALCRLPGLGPVLVRRLNAFARRATSMAMSRRRLTSGEKRGYLFPYDSWDHRVAINAFVHDIPRRKSHRSRPSLDAAERASPCSGTGRC